MVRLVPVQAMLDLRQRFPRYGEPKLVSLLRGQGVILAESTVGRMLASLTRRRLLIEPHAVPA